MRTSHRADKSDQQDALRLFLRKNLLDVKTNQPAVITFVDYDKCCVNVQPTITTETQVNRFLPTPELYEVPLLIYSGNSGKARQTMPIKVGDIVELTYADRDTVNWLVSTGANQVNPDSSYPLSLGGQHYVLVAKPCITLQANARPIDPENIVTENEHSKVTQKPDGTTIVTNSKGATWIIGADNTLNFTGDVATVNGCQITKDGNVITKSGVNLDKFFEQYQKHLHGGVKAGSDKTSAPEA